MPGENFALGRPYHAVMQIPFPLLRSALTVALGATLGVMGQAGLRRPTRIAAPAPVDAPPAPALRDCPAPRSAPQRVVTVIASEVGHHVAGIEGRLIDQKGSPLSGSVMAKNEREEVFVDAGEDGRFFFDLPAGEFALTGYASANVDTQSETIDHLVISAGERVIGIDLRVQLPSTKTETKTETTNDASETRSSEPREPEADSREDRQREAERIAIMACVESCGSWNTRAPAECVEQVYAAAAATSECRSQCNP